ncbi:MAG: DUF1254 domain-containing protein [Actinobacteria bacterium]|nr:DUF1254 domain-containing protein [Actinomycetota bacterium]
MNEALRDLAAEAFDYGFPLVFNLGEIGRVTTSGLGALPAAKLNEFGHATKLAGPEEKFVSINNDTVYSVAIVDLGGGPVRLEVPDTAGRYYVLQFVDAWTDNFAYVGHRATGTEAGTYLLVPPGWDGTAPAGSTAIRFPTRIGVIVGRWAVDGEADMSAVRELQSGLRLIPEGGPAPGLPAPAEGIAEDLVWFERLRTYLDAFPPADRDRAYQERFRLLGVLDERSPFLSPSPEVAEALRAGLALGRDRLERGLHETDAPSQNGWTLSYHAFDYNLDFFEVGAKDETRWKLPDGEGRYLMRALAARGGLWGNHGYEAAYAMVYLDGDGDPLDGTGRYTLTFAEEPPCGAFWSVTMYDTPDFYLVANPIGRYSIGDRTPGLRRGEDGSLTIHMQAEAPEEPAARANWLPTPGGAFRPILRMYEPGEAIFDGRYELPPIVKAT